MFSARDISIAAVSAALTLGGVAAASVMAETPVLGPMVWTWQSLEARPTDVGLYRQIVRQRTATLDELEIHVTTLNAGLSSHPPHRHVNEELIIIDEGEVEVLNEGVWKHAGPGSVIFNASNSEHALRNVGDTPATYHVINWSPQ